MDWKHHGELAYPVESYVSLCALDVAAQNKEGVISPPFLQKSRSCGAKVAFACPEEATTPILKKDGEDGLHMKHIGEKANESP